MDAIELIDQEKTAVVPITRDKSPLRERIVYGFDITALLVTERILPVFVMEVKVL